MFMGGSLSPPAPLRSGRLQRIPSFSLSLPLFPSGNAHAHVMSALGGRTIQGFRVKQGLSCVIRPFGRQGLASTLRQHCPQMTQRHCRQQMRETQFAFHSGGGEKV